MITVIGEHTDGTHAELIAVPESNVFPLDDAIDFETAAAFPLVYETAYRMLVTKAELQADEWVLIWGIGGGVATASFEIARALVRRPSSPPARTRSWNALVRGAPTLPCNHATGDVAAAQRRSAASTSSSRPSARRPGSTRSRRSRPGGGVTVCGATSGPNPPAQLHRFWWKS